jgi:hypothetical protein
MSVELHDKLIALLSDVDALKNSEAQLKSEKARHMEIISASECEISRLKTELEDVRENQLRLKGSMDDLKEELFKRDEREEIVEDQATRPIDGEEQNESAAHRAWRARARELKAVQ